MMPVVAPVVRVMLESARIWRGGFRPRCCVREIRNQPTKMPRPSSRGALVGDSSRLASESTGVSALAERYATALFEIADERRALDGVAADLRQLRQMLAESTDLLRLVRSPILSRADQARAVEAL